MTPIMLRGRATAGSAGGRTEREAEGGRIEPTDGGRLEFRSDDVAGGNTDARSSEAEGYCEARSARAGGRDDARSMMAEVFSSSSLGSFMLVAFSAGFLYGL
jgi:hypothetical protein